MGKASKPRQLADNEAKAVGRMIRTSPQKLNLVAQLIRGKKAEKAVADLTFSRRRVSGEVKKVLESAIANAENNNNLSSDALTIKSTIIEEGPAFKRFRPAARGSAHPYKKRTSHIRIVLTDEN